MAGTKTLQAGQADQEEQAVQEILLQDFRAVVEKVALCHPLFYNDHNICEMPNQGKLASFSVKMLQDLCCHFEMEISTIQVRRKKPYIDRVVAFVKQCT